MWKEELETAQYAAVEAGKAIMEFYKNVDVSVEYKDDHSPLTAADKAANQRIVKILKNRFPSYAILSEEEKDDKSRLDKECCFIVDQLDGTKEFLKRNGQFTVNIALAYRQESVMGVIYVPVAETLYYAVKGFGSFVKSREGVTKRLSTSRNTEISSLRVVMSSSHGCAQMDEMIEKTFDSEIINREG